MKRRIQELKDEIKEYGMKLGASKIGVASLDRFSMAPNGLEPRYYLPEAESVIVIALAIPRTIGKIWGTYREGGKTIGPYMWYGFGHLNWQLSDIAANLSRFIEKNGYEALPFPPTGFPYRYFNIGDFSHRHAAVAAGLGEFGWNRLLLTPEFGAFQRIVSIVTNAPLEADEMYNGPKLCDRKMCGEICVNVCPMEALHGETKCEIGRRVFRYAELSEIKCRWGCSGLHENSGSRTHIEIPEKPNRVDLTNAIKQRNVEDNQMYIFTYVNFCGKCLHQCPSPNFGKGGVRYG